MSVSISRRTVPDSLRVLAAAGVDPGAGPAVRLARCASAQPSSIAASRALPPFGSLRNIEAAATRLADAIVAGEKIVIVADYDADGATACAVGVRGLAAMGANVDYLVPNRFEYGYGLTPEIVELARAKSPRLIVTVDNGIGSHEGVAAATAAGIDVLVTDHHLPGDRLPAPAIIVNPNQPGCAFPSKHLAGVGVMFYVLAATRAHLRASGSLAGDRRTSRRCSISLRSVRSPTSCASITRTASSSSRACAGCARARRVRACSRCSRSPDATCARRRRPTSASSPVRG